MASSKTILFVPVLVTTLVSCSGSSTPNDASSPGTDQGTTEILQPSTPVNGFIQVNENKGKRIFDGYFTAGKALEPADPLIWEDGERACYARSDLAKGANKEDFRPATHNNLYAGESIEIHGRTGNYISLQPQYLGSSVTYASDARWTSTQLPEDALLSVSGSERFPEMNGVALSPLQSIKRLAPASGTLPADDSNISWEAGSQAGDQIQLVLTALYENTSAASTATNQLDRVYCNLPDTGAFTIPSGIRNALGQPSTLFVSMSRRRISVFMQETNELTVSQVSYD